MTVAYWIVAGLLALLYLFSGGSKVLRSREQLQPMMNWVDDMPMAAVRAIGVAEILGALGLILPPLTGIAPGLALAATVGLLLSAARRHRVPPVARREGEHRPEHRVGRGDGCAGLAVDDLALSPTLTPRWSDRSPRATAR